jgi:hypothetical protein
MPWPSCKRGRSSGVERRNRLDLIKVNIEIGNYRLVVYVNRQCWQVQRRTGRRAEPDRNRTVVEPRWAGIECYPDDVGQGLRLLARYVRDDEGRRQLERARLAWEDTVLSVAARVHQSTERSEDGRARTVVSLGPYRLILCQLGDSKYWSIEQWHEGGRVVLGGRGAGKESKPAWRPMGKYPRTVRHGLGYMLEFLIRERPGTCNLESLSDELKKILSESAPCPAAGWTGPPWSPFLRSATCCSQQRCASETSWQSRTCMWMPKYARVGPQKAALSLREARYSPDESQAAGEPGVDGTQCRSCHHYYRSHKLNQHCGISEDGSFLYSVDTCPFFEEKIISSCPTCGGTQEKRRTTWLILGCCTDYYHE